MKNCSILSLLEILGKHLRNKCFFAVFGGIAVDSYKGHFTRFHDDVDLICWRKDIPMIQKVLREMGFKSKLFYHPREKSLIYKLCTLDKGKSITFQIADQLRDDRFEISFWPYTHLVFPARYLKINWNNINNIEIPAVSKIFLIRLKKMQLSFYEKGKKKNLENYLFKQKRKVKKAIHDLKILEKSPTC